MSAAMNEETQMFHWLVEEFVKQTAGVVEAIAVSSDGLLLGSSGGADRENVDQLAAMTAGLTSLTRGAAEMFAMASVQQVLVEMLYGNMLVATISDGSALAVLTDKTADLGVVGYEMAMLIERVGAVLTPELVHHLQNPLVA